MLDIVEFLVSEGVVCCQCNHSSLLMYVVFEQIRDTFKLRKTNKYIPACTYVIIHFRKKNKKS